jgi:tetratricopeptide (TPR) repeat protein/transcriptional regulator with XRE-family HTH domain
VTPGQREPSGPGHEHRKNPHENRQRENVRAEFGSGVLSAERRPPGSRGQIVTDVLAGFAGVLRELRTDAGLTQEELAEAAGLSSRAISYLERGEVGTPHRETIRLLADALALAGPARAEFEAAARGRGRAGAAGIAATRGLPRDVASFTGRQRELDHLADAAASAGAVVSIHAIGGMAGIGKTAFAVHAAHRLADRFPGGQIFVPLHGHTPGQLPADPADSLATMLAALGVPASQIPAKLEPRMALWRDRAAGRELLLVLDDAVSSEQVRPLLPGSGGSLVLVTSRRHLSALEEATVISLDTLPPGEAAELLARLAGLTGLTGEDPAVTELARLCGYLPLAIGMVARHLRHHPAWTAAGRAAALATAANRVELLATENLSVASAFDLSYADLSGDQQRLFRRLGLHPGPDIDAYAVAALDGISLPAARRGLEDLYDQYLLTEPAPGRYRLHDLIREYARVLAARLDTDADREQAMARLLDYYQDTAARADSLIARLGRPGRATADRAAPAAAPDLVGPEQALAWLRAERASLLGCLDHATATGEHHRVIGLTAGLSGLLQRDGPWTEAISRFTTAIATARRVGDRLGQAGALNDLGYVRNLTGDYPAATEAHGDALGIFRDLGDRLGEANSFHALGLVLRSTGDYRAAADDLEQALDIYRVLRHQLGQTNTLHALGDVLRLRGDYQAAADALEQSLGIYRDLGDGLGQAHALFTLGEVLRATGDYPAAGRAYGDALDLYRKVGSRLGESNALKGIGAILRLTGDYSAAVQTLDQALGIYREIGNRLGEANALNILGNALRLTGDYPAALGAQEEALAIYRQIGGRLGQANALNAIGIVLRLTGEYAPAAEAHQQALSLYRQIGDQAGQAEALNDTGTLHRVTGEPELAEECHTEALELASVIGSSWEEAHALAGLGRCAVAAGRTAEGDARLRQAQAIFQRIGATEAAEVAAELDALSGPAVGDSKL